MILEKPISISPKAAAQIHQGRLWIFSNELTLEKPFPPAGSWTHFECQGRIVGTGYINPHSLIAGRIVSREKVDDLPSSIGERLRMAFQARLRKFSEGSCRLIFSESDLLSGLIVDFYSGVLVLQSNTAGIDQILPILEISIPEIFREVFKTEINGMVIRGESNFRKLEGIENFKRITLGAETELKNGKFSNNGVYYAADFLDGQKTGFYLDQTDNRSYLAKWVGENPGAKILDLFCYSGGWGLRALNAGDCQVTLVDESREALDLVRKGIELNHIPPAKTSIVTSEVFKFLEGTADTFDLIVADPPAFAKSKKDIPKALKGYEKLNRLAWRHIRENGTLITSSCSYHVREEEFLGVVQKAVAREGGSAQISFRGGQSSDHPVLLSMPETNYLKCFALKKLT